MKIVSIVSLIVLGLAGLGISNSSDSRARIADSAVRLEAVTGDLQTPMRALGESFRGFEAALGAADAAALGVHASAMATETRALSTTSQPGEPEGFGANLLQAAELATSVARLVGESDVTRAGRAFEELRGACVTCHIRFRDGPRGTAWFPAKHNTLSGVVRITTKQGEARADASNVLVFLEGVELDAANRAPWRSSRISQKDARFEPRVLPILAGSEVEFPNDDFIYHNVFSLSEVRPFDLGAYGPGGSRTVSFPRTGLVRVYCNIHPQMLSTIIVLDNPCFGLTDRKGRFVIPGIPDGKYILRTWHEFGGEARQAIELSGATITELTLPLQEERVVLEHKNKFNKPYREKY